MLKVTDWNASYGVIPVLHNVSLEVKPGEIVALLGSNGAGKTTLLNSISGIVKGRSGSISFFDQGIEDLPPNRVVETGIAQIPEGRKIFPYLTVKENLLMGASFSRLGGKDRSCWRRSPRSSPS